MPTCLQINAMSMTSHCIQRPGAIADLERLVALKRKEEGIAADAVCTLESWDRSYYHQVLLKDEHVATQTEAPTWMQLLREGAPDGVCSVGYHRVFFWGGVVRRGNAPVFCVLMRLQNQTRRHHDCGIVGTALTTS